MRDRVGRRLRSTDIANWPHNGRLDLNQNLARFCFAVLLMCIACLCLKKMRILLEVWGLKMSRLTVVAIAVASLVGVGVAQSAPVAQYNWTGFYVGVNAGGAWGHSDATTSTILPTINYLNAANVARVNSSGLQKPNTNGFIGGAQAGYNFQTGNIVLGAEADFQSFRQRGSASTTGCYAGAGCPGPYTINSSVSTDWLFTARPRLGWTFNNWLVFATGGVTVTQLKGDFTFNDNLVVAGNGPASESASLSGTKAGWTAGGGLELGMNSGWSIKGEYLYVDFGSVSTTSANFFTGGIAGGRILSKCSLTA